MLELADRHASGVCVARRGGSNPPRGTIFTKGKKPSLSFDKRLFQSATNCVEKWKN